MNNLWLILVVLTLCAMAFVAVPLWRNRRTHLDAAEELEKRRESNRTVFLQRQAELDRELEEGVVSAGDHARLVTELQRAFLRDMEELSSLQVKTSTRRSLALPIVALALIPVVSSVLYQRWGAAQDLALPGLIQAVREATDEDSQRSAIEAVIAELQERFERKPEDLQSAYMLGIYYLQLERNAEAASVFERMARDMPPSQDRATVLGQWAQAEYLLADAQITDKVQRLIDEALDLNPNENSVLTILAFDALGRQDLVGAIGYWQRQLAATNPNSQQAQILRQRIAAVEAYLPEEQRPSRQAAASGSTITLVVDLDPQFKDQLDEYKSLFVYVRNPAMQMPIVAQNIPVPEFPVTLTLSDADSMMGMTLASVPELLAGARLSRSGEALRGAGDLMVESAPFKLAEQEAPLNLTIDEVVE
jgi:cytochrome c-type biogenesis protein CcmI